MFSLVGDICMMCLKINCRSTSRGFPCMFVSVADAGGWWHAVCEGIYKLGNGISYLVICCYYIVESKDIIMHFDN